MRTQAKRRRNMHTTTERDERLRALLDLVQAREFRTQSELVKALRRMDFQVTQSSVSRDIRDLGLRKRGGVYTAPREVLAGPDGVEVWDFAKSVIAAGDHMVVLKCQTAMAQPLAVAIDRARWPGVAGTIAGDDTVFIAVTDGEATRELVRRIGTIAELGPEPMR